MPDNSCCSDQMHRLVNEWGGVVRVCVCMHMCGVSVCACVMCVHGFMHTPLPSPVLVVAINLSLPFPFPSPSLPLPSPFSFPFSFFPAAPILSSQGMARMCCDPRRSIRHMAISYLQRALLAHDLLRLSPNEWKACFQEVRGTFCGGEGGAWTWEQGDLRRGW